MATAVRCPGCGAKNPDDSIKCRICSYDMRTEAEKPLSQPQAGSAAMRSGSLKGVMALAILGVAAIVLAGVLLDVLPGGDVITDVRNKIPLIASESSDGWEEFTEPPARFSATMPVDRTSETESFPGAASGSLDEWVSTLGPDDQPDTTLTVGWTTVPESADENVEASLVSSALAWAASIGGTVEAQQRTSFQGQPALVVRIEGLRTTDGDEVTIRGLLIRRRDQLFVLSSRSIYEDHPQFSRLANGFTML
jgi:hypothetical protein